jgi:hypothetical protein
MVATQQVREKCDMRLDKECLAGLTHRKHDSNYSRTQDMDHTITSTVGESI